MRKVMQYLKSSPSAEASIASSLLPSTQATAPSLSAQASEARRNLPMRSQPAASSRQTAKLTSWRAIADHVRGWLFGLKPA